LLSENLEKRIRAYEVASVIAAIAVHFGVFLNALITLVILKMPVSTFLILHVGLQIFTFLNALFGGKIIRSYIKFLNTYNLRFGQGVFRFISYLIFKKS